jgi:hypothetical protein
MKFDNSTIWDSSSPKFIRGGSQEAKFDHPTQEPVSLRQRRPIRNHTRRRELVYDPFVGSGTTLAAAEQTGRVCHGLVLDPKYADVIVERWQALTDRQAAPKGDGRGFRGDPSGAAGRGRQTLPARSLLLTLMIVRNLKIRNPTQTRRRCNG